MAPERGDEISSSGDFPDKFKDGYKLLELQIVFVQEGKETVAFEQDACIVNESQFQELLGCYRDACSCVEKHRSNKEVRLEAGLGADQNKSEC